MERKNLHKEKILKILLIIITILFGVSTTTSYISQNNLVSELNFQINRQWYFSSQQEEFNIADNFNILCNMSNNPNSTACKKFEEKQQGIGSHYNDWKNDQRGFSNGVIKSNKNYSNFNLISIISFLIGIFLSFIALIITLIMHCRNKKREF